MKLSPNAICISSGPAIAITIDAIPANAAMARIVTVTDALKSSSAPSARRRVRWGRRLVETAWNSWRGARAIIRMLKMYPAAAAPALPLTRSGPAFRNACSLSMIRNTAAAKPPPWASVNSASAGRSPSASALPPCSASAFAGAPRRRNANGTTMRDSVGAATIPSATASWPVAIPTATASGNAVRDTDSLMISIA